jgi:hypothetical protein
MPTNQRKRPGPQKIKSSEQLRREGARPSRIRAREAREAEERGEAAALLIYPDPSPLDRMHCGWFCTRACSREFRGERCIFPEGWRADPW